MGLLERCIFKCPGSPLSQWAVVVKQENDPSTIRKPESPAQDTGRAASVSKHDGKAYRSVTNPWLSTPERPRYGRRKYEGVLQPDSSPITEQQLAAEIKGIYEGLSTVEIKCIDTDAALARDTDFRLDPEREQKQAFSAWDWFFPNQGPALVSDVNRHMLGDVRATRSKGGNKLSTPTEPVVKCLVDGIHASAFPTAVPMQTTSRLSKSVATTITRTPNKQRTSS